MQTDAEVAEKLQKTNESGNTVKTLDFGIADVEMEDIKDIPTSLAENLRNACTRTVGVQTSESQNSMFHPEPMFLSRPCPDFNLLCRRRQGKILHRLPSFEILNKVYSYKPLPNYYSV